MLNICKFLEYFGKSRKFILRNKEFKFWHLQNFIKEKPYKTETFNFVFNGACAINLSSYSASVKRFIYLTLYLEFKKNYLEKHTSHTQ